MNWIRSFSIIVLALAPLLAGCTGSLSIWGVNVPLPGDEGDDDDPTSDDDVLPARHNGRCCLGNALEPRRAEAIDRHGRYVGRNTSPEPCGSSNVHSLLCLGERRANDHVIEVGWVDASRFHGALEGDAHQVVRAGVLEVASF